MNGSEFAALMTLALAMSFTPGPNTLLATALAANLGLRRTWRFVVAVPAGWALVMLVSGFGIGTAVVALPWLRDAIRVLGAGYLAWMAVRLVRSRPGSASVVVPPKEIGFWQGVGLQFVNVKAWTLATAVAGGWVATSAGRAAVNPGERLTIVVGVLASLALASVSCYALVGASLRSSLSVGRRMIWFNRAMGGLLLGVAGWMIRL